MISCKEQHIKLTYVEKTCINHRYTYFTSIFSIKFTFWDMFCRYNTFFNFSKISNCWTEFEGFFLKKMHQKLLSPAEQLSSPCVGCHIFHMLLFGKETNLGVIIRYESKSYNWYSPKFIPVCSFVHQMALCYAWWFLKSCDSFKIWTFSKKKEFRIEINRCNKVLFFKYR